MVECLSRLISREELSLQLVLFLAVSDVLALECVSRAIAGLLRNNLLWKLVYTTNFTLSDPKKLMEDHLRRKLHRPHREHCIGWRVNILQENDSHLWRRGVILDFRVNASLHEEFLVDYGEERVWEEERRRHVAWHLTGLSRFDFISPIHEDSKWNGGIPLKYSSDSEMSVLDQFHALKDDCDWREECHLVYDHLPSKCLFSLEFHKDEVLDVEFSHDGTMLATVSRDGKVGVVEFESSAEGSIGIRRIRLVRTERDLNGISTYSHRFHP